MIQLQAFLTKNRVFLLGLAASVSVVLQQYLTQPVINWIVIGYAAGMAALSYVANEWRGQGVTILGIAGTLAGTFVTIQQGGNFTWNQFILSAVAAVLAAVAPPAKSLSYEQAPQIMAAKGELPAGTASGAKLAGILLLLIMGMSASAQSPFRAEKRLGRPMETTYNQAVNPLMDSLVNVWRFAVGVSPAGFTFGGNYQAAAGLEYGIQHQDYNYETQTYTVLWSANAVWIPINTGAPIRSIQDIASFGALVGIKNNLIQVGPFYNPNAPSKDKLGIWLVLGINLN